MIGRLHALVDRLEQVGGRLISDSAITQAIAQTNAKRGLLQQVSQLWRGSESAITGTDALAITSAAYFMDDKSYTRALNALLADPPRPLPQAPRILIKGSPQSDLRFTSLVEQLGARVVAHDHLWGDRTYASIVDESIDPRSAIARHYCFDIPSPREYPQAKADERFIDLVKRTRTDGVIFYHDEWDDTLGWEYPDQKQLLDALGVASLFLKRQPYFDPPENEQRRIVHDFVESLRRTR